jgi:hypothetical protein
MQVVLNEADLQMVILSLAICGIQRPGWMPYLANIAATFGRREMFDTFVATQTPTPPRTNRRIKVKGGTRGDFT